MGFGILFPDMSSERHVSKVGERCSTVNCCVHQAGFDILLTTDQNLVYQQNLGNRKIAVVALGRNRWSLIQPALQRITLAVNAAQPGSYTLVDIPGK